MKQPLYTAPFIYNQTREPLLPQKRRGSLTHRVAGAIAILFLFLASLRYLPSSSGDYDEFRVGDEEVQPVVSVSKTPESSTEVKQHDDEERYEAGEVKVSAADHEGHHVTESRQSKDADRSLLPVQIPNDVKEADVGYDPGVCIYDYAAGMSNSDMIFEVSLGEYWLVRAHAKPVIDCTGSCHVVQASGPQGTHGIFWAQIPTGWEFGASEGRISKRNQLCGGSKPQYITSQRNFCMKPYLRLYDGADGPRDYPCPVCHCTHGSIVYGPKCTVTGEKCSTCHEGYLMNSAGVCTKDEVAEDTIGWENCLKVADQISSSDGEKMCGACRSIKTCEFVAGQTYTVTSQTNGVRMYISNVASGFVLAVDQYATNIKVSAVDIKARVHSNSLRRRLRIDNQNCATKKDVWKPDGWDHGATNNCEEFWTSHANWAAGKSCSKCADEFYRKHCAFTCCTNCNNEVEYPDYDASKSPNGNTAKASSYYELMAGTVKECPAGAQISSKQECQRAYDALTPQWAFDAARGMQSAKWLGVPKACSVQFNNKDFDQAPHWNTNPTSSNSRVGEFRVICKKTTTSAKPADPRWFCVPGQQPNGNNCNKANGGLQMWYLIGQAGSGNCGKDILNGAKNILCMGDSVKIHVATNPGTSQHSYLHVGSVNQAPIVSESGGSSIWVIEAVNKGREGPVVTGRAFLIKHKTHNCYLATKCKLPEGKNGAGCLQQTDNYEQQPALICQSKPTGDNPDLSRFTFNFEVRPYNVDEDEVFGKFTIWESYDMRPVSPLAPYIADTWNALIADNPGAIWANADFGKFLVYPLGNITEFVNRQINANMMTSIDYKLRDAMGADWAADYWWSDSLNTLTPEDKKQYDTLLQFSIAGSMKKSAADKKEDDPFPSCSTDNIGKKTDEIWESDWGKQQLVEVREDLLFSVFPKWKEYQQDAKTWLQKLAVFVNSPHFAVWLGREVPYAKMNDAISHIQTVAISLSNNIDDTSMSWDPQYQALFEKPTEEEKDVSVIAQVKHAPPVQSPENGVVSEHWDRAEIAVGIENRRALDTLTWPNPETGVATEFTKGPTGVLCCPTASGATCSCASGTKTCTCGGGANPCSFATNTCYYWGQCDPSCVMKEVTTTITTTTTTATTTTSTTHPSGGNPPNAGGTTGGGGSTPPNPGGTPSAGSGKSPNFADDTVCLCTADNPANSATCSAHTDARSCTATMECMWGPESSQKCMSQVPACETFIGVAGINALPADCMRERVVKGISSAQVTAMAGMNPLMILAQYTEAEFAQILRDLSTLPDSTFTGVLPTDYTGPNDPLSTSNIAAFLKVDGFIAKWPTELYKATVDVVKALDAGAEPDALWKYDWTAVAERMDKQMGGKLSEAIQDEDVAGQLSKYQKIADKLKIFNQILAFGSLINVFRKDIGEWKDTDWLGAIKGVVQTVEFMIWSMSRFLQDGVSFINFLEARPAIMDAFSSVTTSAYNLGREILSEIYVTATTFVRNLLATPNIGAFALECLESSATLARGVSSAVRASRLAASFAGLSSQFAARFGSRAVLKASMTLASKSMKEGSKQMMEKYIPIIGVFADGLSAYYNFRNALTAMHNGDNVVAVLELIQGIGNAASAVIGIVSVMCFVMGVAPINPLIGLAALGVVIVAMLIQNFLLPHLKINSKNLIQSTLSSNGVCSRRLLRLPSPNLHLPHPGRIAIPLPPPHPIVDRLEEQDL